MTARSDSETRDGFGKGPRPFPILLLALFAFAVPGILQAAESCSRYRINYGNVDVVGEPLYATTPAAVCASSGPVFIADRNGLGLSSTYHMVSVALYGGVSECRITYYRVRNSDGFQYANSTFTYNVTLDGTMECPVDACSALAGLVVEGGGSGSWSGVSLCRTEDAGGEVLPGSGCKVVRAGVGLNMSGGWFGQTRVTGESCSGTETVVNPDPPDCVTGPGGQVCVSGQPEGCGTVNGERVCLDAIAEGSCMLLANGGAICADGAGPVDEAETPIPPDVVIEDVTEEEGEDFGYYGPSTVAGGAEPLTGNPNTGAQNTGPGPVDMSEEAAEFGGGPDDDWDASAGMGAALSGVAASGWFGVLTGSASALSGSSTCPSVVLDVAFMDTSFDLFESACGYMAPHYSMWTVIMQIAWGLLALRIFLAGSRD